MAKRGPKPAPTHVKLLRGSRADRINAAEPIAPPGRPDPPAHLDAVAKAEWDRIAPILEGMGLLTTVDGTALALYCSAFSRWAQASAEVASKGTTIPTGTGSWKQNPAITIAAQAETFMLRVLAEFGMTPSSRSRVEAIQPPKADPLDRWRQKWRHEEPDLEELMGQAAENKRAIHEGNRQSVREMNEREQKRREENERFRAEYLAKQKPGA